MDNNMKKALTFLMMTIMMVAVTTIISQTHEVYAENKAKDLCSQGYKYNEYRLDRFLLLSFFCFGYITSYF